MANTVTALHPNLRVWVADSVRDKFCKALTLTAEDSRTDPPEEPYCSLYAARELLVRVKAALDSCSPELKSLEDFTVLRACVELQLGLNYVNTEEMGLGEEAFAACLHLLEGVVSKVKTASLSVQAYNQLGVLWGNRSEQQKALEFLLKSKAVHESHIALPPPLTVTEWLSGEVVGEWEREKAFESLHTHTLFYLAQAYGNLNQAKVSAQYCRETLSRQLETKEFDSIEWSLNCATLSQYYLGVEAFLQARHCLAAASCVLSQCENEGREEEEEVEEKKHQTGADISRCWTKYCIGLLRKSRDKMEGEEEEESHSTHRLFRFEPLEVADLESAVPCDLVESYDGARTVFLFGQKHLNIAKEFYTVDHHCSEYVAILQDHSQLFKLVAYFQPDKALSCRMHKRRVDMLSAILQELNPQHYLSMCRQLMFELAETTSEMADHKIVLASDSPSTHAVAKINKLLHSAIKYYEKFVATFLDSSGNMPDPVAEEFLRPLLCAKMYSARLHTKLISPDTASQVRLT